MAIKQLFFRRRSPRVFFQIMSDLHLEVGRQYADFDIPPKAPYLVLAGDIGRLVDFESLRDFLALQCSNFEKVFYVLGNHEFYGTSRVRGLEIAAKLQEEPGMRGRLYIMNKNCHDIDSRVLVLGCTLQSNITPETRDLVRMKVQDFSNIEGWTVDDHNAAYEEDVSWLHAQLSASRPQSQKCDQKVIVLTHYAPTLSQTSSAKDAANPWSTAFSTQLIGNKQFPAFSRIHTWIFGHTHHSTSLVEDGVRIIGNMRGYVLPKAPYILEASTSKESARFWEIWSKKAKRRSECFDIEKTIAI